MRGIRGSVIGFSIVVRLEFYDTEDILIFAVDELISEVGDYNRHTTDSNRREI